MRPDEDAIEVVRRPIRGEARAPEAGPPERRSSTPGMALAPRGAPGHAFFERRDSSEIEQLLQPTRPREGRQRIVRAETPPAGGPRLGPTVVPTLAPPLVQTVVPTLAPPLVQTVVATLAPPAPPPLPRALRVWHIRLPGEEAPIVVEAGDIGGAVRAGAALLPPELWNAMSIRLFDARALDPGS